MRGRKRGEGSFHKGAFKHFKKETQPQDWIDVAGAVVYLTEKMNLNK